MADQRSQATITELASSSASPRSAPQGATHLAVFTSARSATYDVITDLAEHIEVFDFRAFNIPEAPALAERAPLLRDEGLRNWGRVPSGTVFGPADLRDYCLSRPGAIEDFPFGDEVSVFKVGGKMFALATLDARSLAVNLKCDPDLAVDLRRRHAAVQPGYHQNKRHWNTVTIDGSIPDDEIRDMIDDSYDLVVMGLPQRLRPGAAG